VRNYLDLRRTLEFDFSRLDDMQIRSGLNRVVVVVLQCFKCVTYRCFGSVAIIRQDSLEQFPVGFYNGFVLIVNIRKLQI
jgi:hypothetical protein